MSYIVCCMNLNKTGGGREGGRGYLVIGSSKYGIETKKKKKDRWFSQINVCMYA